MSDSNNKSPITIPSISVLLLVALFVVLLMWSIFSASKVIYAQTALESISKSVAENFSNLNKFNEADKTFIGAATRLNLPPDAPEDINLCKWPNPTLIDIVDEKPSCIGTQEDRQKFSIAAADKRNQRVATLSSVYYTLTLSCSLAKRYLTTEEQEPCKNLSYGHLELSDRDPKKETQNPEIFFEILRLSVEKDTRENNNYFLPIAFGFFGACIFALWQILSNYESNNDKITITATDAIQYWLRACLGAISGLIIGYVSIPVKPDISASPLFLSLVAGFSVDAVISILNRISSSLTYENTIEPKK